MASFNFEQALKQLQFCKSLTVSDGVLTSLNKQLTKAALQAQLDQHQAIAAVFPDTGVQHCVIHQICNSPRYVGSKYHKAFMADLNLVCRAADIPPLD